MPEACKESESKLTCSINSLHPTTILAELPEQRQSAYPLILVSQHEAMVIDPTKGKVSNPRDVTTAVFNHEDQAIFVVASRRHSPGVIY